MRKILCWAASVAVGWVAAASAAEAAAGGGDGWTSLFNGRDLSGWTVECVPADREKIFWKVTDGAIRCDSSGRKDHDYVWLLSAREYRDFELRLKFRTWRGVTGNSGLQVRSRYDRGAGWLDGPQIDIAPATPWRTGMMWDETRGVQRWIHPDLPKGKWVAPEMAPAGFRFKFADEEDGWNDLAVTVTGACVRAKLNGVTVTDLNGAALLDDPAHRARNVGAAGHIALQLHRGDELKIEFKDVFVREPVGRE